MPVDKFVHVTKRICGLPSFFNLPLCKRIKLINKLNNSSDQGTLNNKDPINGKDLLVKFNEFMFFWKTEIEPYDAKERFFRVVKCPSAEYILREDFSPYIQELLHFHPGLEFLDGQEEFQKKYALTVITRIFYKVNSSRFTNVLFSY